MKHARMKWVVGMLSLIGLSSSLGATYASKWASPSSEVRTTVQNTRGRTDGLRLIYDPNTYPENVGYDLKAEPKRFNLLDTVILRSTYWREHYRDNPFFTNKSISNLSNAYVISKKTYFRNMNSQETLIAYSMHPSNEHDYRGGIAIFSNGKSVSHFTLEGVEFGPENVRVLPDLNGDGLNEILVASLRSAITTDQPDEGFILSLAGSKPKILASFPFNHLFNTGPMCMEAGMGELFGEKDSPTRCDMSYDKIWILKSSPFRIYTQKVLVRLKGLHFYGEPHINLKIDRPLPITFPKKSNRGIVNLGLK